MKKLNDVWDWLNGKKLIIGAILGLILQGIDAAFPGTIPPGVHDWIVRIIDVLTGAGLAHKAIKYGSNKKSGNSTIKDNQQDG